MCYFADSRADSRGQHSLKRQGTVQVQAEDYQDSIRPGLIAMLPRLKRFAGLLVGERKAGAALLGRALNRMLAEQHRYQRGTAIDRFAFAEIYRHWLGELRNRADHGAQHEIDDAGFALLFGREDEQAFDPFTARYLRSLPPQQRLTLLLVYGEGFDHIDAGRVLDIPSETVAVRLVRLSTTFADFLSARADVPARTPAVETIDPEAAAP
jgi:DNA-directed RNA polymerase specialized sigma24 family protein